MGLGVAWALGSDFLSPERHISPQLGGVIRTVRSDRYSFPLETCPLAFQQDLASYVDRLQGTNLDEVFTDDLFIEAAADHALAFSARCARRRLNTANGSSAALPAPSLSPGHPRARSPACAISCTRPNA